MPRISYDESDIAALKVDQEYYDSLLSTPKTLMPLTDQVREMEQRLAKCQALCSEIVTSLTLEGNAHWFAGLPSDWRDRVEDWKKRLGKLGAICQDG